MAIFIDMKTFKIKAEDKAAFLSRAKDLDVKIGKNNIKDGSESVGGKSIDYFVVTVSNPDDISKINDILKQSSGINRLKEAIKKEIRKYLES